MASRPLKREYGQVSCPHYSAASTLEQTNKLQQGYSIPSRQPLPWDGQVNDDEEDADNCYDQRRYSATGSDLATSPPYGSRPPMATSAYSSYGYPAPSNPHAPYTPHYAYENQSYTTSYSQPHTANEGRSPSPTAYRSQYSNAEYSTAYSSTHETTPAITYTHAAAPSLVTSTDYWNNSQHGHDSYANSDNHSPAQCGTTHGLIRTPSQRSDGNRSQTSSDG